MVKVEGMSQVTDTSIVALRLHHCRAEHAMRDAQYHLAALNYRRCLETAESRFDCQAVSFFALKLVECYTHMGLSGKANSFRQLAHCCSSTNNLEDCLWHTSPHLDNASSEAWAEWGKDDWDDNAAVF